MCWEPRREMEGHHTPSYCLSLVVSIVETICWLYGCDDNDVLSIPKGPRSSVTVLPNYYMCPLENRTLVMDAPELAVRVSIPA
jgi:hypothetical protein